jgi:hypothetical protein
LFVSCLLRPSCPRLLAGCLATAARTLELWKVSGGILDLAYRRPVGPCSCRLAFSRPCCLHLAAVYKLLVHCSSPNNTTTIESSPLPSTGNLGRRRSPPAPTSATLRVRLIGQTSCEALSTALPHRGNAACTVACSSSCAQRGCARSSICSPRWLCRALGGMVGSRIQACTGFSASSKIIMIINECCVELANMLLPKWLCVQVITATDVIMY